MEASVATPAQGAPPAATQPPASGQGGAGQGTTGDGKGDGSFNWGLFPNVPENQRELLQPHLRDVLGHVTRMEQQYSPYKGLMEAVSPDQVQNLVTFLGNYSQDPLSTFLGLAQSLREDGTIQNPQFSVEALQALINGAEEQSGIQPGMEDMPPWAQQMMEQMNQFGSYIQEQQSREQQLAAQQEEQEQARLLAEANTEIRGQLTQTGIPEGLVTDEQIVAALIAYQGDIPRVVQSFAGLRDGFLKGWTEQNGSGPKPPTVNGEVPNAPKGRLRPRSGDAFRQASIGAEQALRQGAAATAQGS